ncbi:Fe-S oxidoreductase [Sphingobium vermicomposti]|uniref:Fe-S oxidoreductase n=1 Tax=Sphingobium vermicomposti TaxID=529005 RepID=A0A846M794_9SPHN|nr:Fe-S oxidoreductase [Sphingobium vermicomposti]NIJ16541.1 hypothetical protein [Sphingobium vermicomposti]
MRSIMFAGIAILAFTTGTAGVAIAQDAGAATAQPPEAGGTMPTDPADPSVSPATPSTSEDPNASQPTGAVPPSTGMVPAPAGVPENPAAPVGSSANPVTVGGNMTPPPTEAKDYPLCSRTVQDSCINPSEAKKTMRKRR